MDQTIINWLLGGFGGLIGFLLNSVWQAVKDLQSADKQLTDKVAAIEILVAGNYVKHDDLKYIIKDMSTAIFTKLDKIETKLDTKVDK